MIFRTSIQRSSVHLWLAALTISVVVGSGCSLKETKGANTAQQTTTPSDGFSATDFQGRSFSGNNYPPEELWRRIKTVINTAPRGLGYQEFGKILGLEFDEEKILWYPSQEPKAYFTVSRAAIRHSDNLPLSSFALSKSVLNRHTDEKSMLLVLELFEEDATLGTLLTKTETYCMKPERQEIEGLGLHYNEAESEMPPLLDFYGRVRWTPYRVDIFENSRRNLNPPDRQLNLKVLSNGCLVGISYSSVFQ